MSPARIVLYALLVVAGYELARWMVLRRIKLFFNRRARRFAERHGTRIDLFKFGGKVLVREELLNDPVIVHAMQETSKKGEQPEDVRRRVEHYIDEIVPAFSLGAYFQLGMTLAKAAIHAVYKPVIDAASMRRLASLPADATAVFVINHRSNFDYVVVAFALARQVAVSYAIGEWARVFPLDALFKAFGGFFVRRGFPDPLYHTVLRRYLQLITRRGVTQGIFLEGGLTRDGALRPPKVGLLDGLLQLATEPEFKRELYFVPVGINYDRVLEDEVLLAEQRGRDRPPSRAEKIYGFVRLLVVTPSRLAINAVRALTGRLHRSGYVAVAFGEPVRWNDAAGTLGVSPKQLGTDEQRRETAKRFAAQLMGRIAQTIPATPVTLVSRALLEIQREITESDLARHVATVRARLQERGVPTALGQEFAGTRRDRAELEEGRSEAIAMLETQLIDAEEATAITRLGIERLLRRRVIRREGGKIAMIESERAKELLEYYSRALPALDQPTVSVEPYLRVRG